MFIIIKLRNWIIPFKLAGLLVLLYIQLTISFLIGEKRTVNFLAADYTIIMSRTLKVTGNHVKFVCLLLAISGEAKTRLPGLLC